MKRSSSNLGLEYLFFVINVRSKKRILTALKQT